MLLPLVILAFSILAIALVSLVDRYAWAHDKKADEHQRKESMKVAYYDAFSERRGHPQGARTDERPEHSRRPFDF